MNSKSATYVVVLLALCICLRSHGADLERHTVRIDDHPFALWEKSVPAAKGQILLLHGRTWSSLPDFDLQVEGESLSLMDGFNQLGYSAWALDARGYGETPRDTSGWLTPNRAAKDVVGIIDWLRQETASETNLFGWSYGSMVAQLVGQQRPDLVRSIILYGYPIDPDRVIVDTVTPDEPRRAPNTVQNAASDFITPGSITDTAVAAYVSAALKADPHRADWKNLTEWNQLDGHQLGVATLLLQAEFDPLADSESHARFFSRISNANKQWVVLSGGDHAALLETPRGRLLHATVQFIEWLDK
jgi:pimeloyl-ACP methyl ester carboxylesterase|tara:strand:- start:4180 stop:5085 length:906 start_codon:yes stop_codon:yes gene_type:complete